jgi:hypothetical protein
MQPCVKFQAESMNLMHCSTAKKLLFRAGTWALPVGSRVIEVVLVLDTNKDFHHGIRANHYLTQG